MIKKTYALLLLAGLMLLARTGMAQLSSYSFAQSAGTYTAITGGTVLGTTANDEEVFNNSTSGGSAPVSGTGFSIGFSFIYNGQSFDKFAVATNGYIVLGTGTFDIDNYSGGVIANTTVDGFANLISAFDQDLEGQTNAELRYQTIGSAPNRTLVVQWKNYKRWIGTTPMNFNFQVRLNETSNTVSIVYGTMSTIDDYDAQVGLRGATNADFNIRQTSGSWATTTAGTTNEDYCTLTSTAFPASGQTYTWTPPSCFAPPLVTITAITQTTAIIGWTAPSPAPSGGYQYEVRSSGAPGSGATGLAASGTVTSAVTSVPVTALTAGTSYSVYVKSDCGGSQSTWSPAYVFGTQLNCSTAIPLTCGVNTTANFTGNGVYDPVVGGCGYATPGKEILYQYTPGVTGTYVLSVSSATGGYVDYFYKAATTCDNTGWNCIDDINGPATATVSLTAGTSYYFLLDAEDITAMSQTFQLQCMCTGTPATGTATASVSSACANTPFTLNATGYATGSGVTYQWQISPAGAGTFTNISGATTVPYTVSGQGAASDYRLVVNCANGSTSANSNAVSITQSAASLCYCTSNLGGSGTSIDTLQILTTTLNNATPGNATGNYTLYPASGSTTAILQQATSYSLHAAYGGSAIGSLWIDYNHSGTYEATEWVQINTSGTSATVSFTVPVTALTGVTGMRIRSRAVNNTNDANSACSNFGSGETEDYHITINASSACTGTPTAGTATASTGAACVAAPFTLNASGYTTGATGITFQWQSSPAGAGTFTDITGATTVPYTVTSQTVATDYRLVVKCTPSNLSANTNTVSVTQNAPINCYCVPTYIDGCADGDDIDTFTLVGAQSTSFNDLGTGCSTNAYDDRTAQPAVKLAPGSTYSGTISCEYGDQANQDGDSENAKFWIDFNDNGIFESADSVGVVTGIASSVTPYSIHIPSGATLGIHRMRVRLAYNEDTATLDACSEYDYGETHDYKVEILCAGLTVNLGPDTLLCNGASIGLDAGNPGATYTWSNGTTAQSNAVTAAGTYWVKVDAGGCSATDTVVVTTGVSPVAGSVNATNNSPSFIFTAAGFVGANSYSWSFGDNGTGTGGTVNHVYTANGTYTVTVVATNDCGTATATTTVTVGGVSVGTVPVSADQLKLYPNPASGLVTIDNLSTLSMQSLTVTNTLGAVVLQKEQLHKAKETLDVSRLAAGVYTVRIRTDKGTVVRQLQVLPH